jgi:hypothetical protein
VSGSLRWPCANPLVTAWIAWRGVRATPAPELPSETVTLLFTDIEGSTRLLREHGDAYAELLGEHRWRLRAAISARGGVETGAVGDALFAAFRRAPDAVRAASDAQAALAAGPVRIRMGLHAGEPIVTDEGYVGLDVHRAARITAAGHGGQVLRSQPHALWSMSMSVTSANIASRISPTASASINSATTTSRTTEDARTARTPGPDHAPSRQRARAPTGRHASGTRRQCYVSGKSPRATGPAELNGRHRSSQ